MTSYLMPIPLSLRAENVQRANEGNPRSIMRELVIRLSIQCPTSGPSALEQPGRPGAIERLQLGAHALQSWSIVKAGGHRHVCVDDPCQLKTLAGQEHG